jgi:hypothetical protein
MTVGEGPIAESAMVEGGSHPKKPPLSDSEVSAPPLSVFVLCFSAIVSGPQGGYAIQVPRS